MQEQEQNITVPKTSKNWLQRLKDESWEAELLVSAIAIYSTFQLLNFFGWATNKFIDILDPSQHHVGYGIVFIGLFAVSILVTMFVIHFFLRAYWIGLVGLNSVFPDYSLEDSAYSKIYTEKMLSILPKLEDSIKKVDELCSVIFSVAFTFLLIYAYIAILASVYLLLFNMLSSYVPTYILLIPLAFLAIVFTLQMVLTILANIKSNREKEGLQMWSFKIVKFSSILLYGPLYKSIFQTTMIFGTNFKKKKSIIFLVLSFVVFGMILAVSQIEKTNIPYLIVGDSNLDSTKMYSEYYQSQNENNSFLLNPEIETDRPESNLVKIFIPIFSHEKNMRDGICKDYVGDASKPKALKRKERRLYYLDCYSRYNLVFFNGNKVDLEYSKYDHPRTKQFGVLGYLDVSNAKAGKNIITIKKEFSKEKNSKEWIIPFYYSLK